MKNLRNISPKILKQKDENSKVFFTQSKRKELIQTLEQDFLGVNFIRRDYNPRLNNPKKK